MLNVCKFVDENFSPDPRTVERSARTTGSSIRFSYKDRHSSRWCSIPGPSRCAPSRTRNRARRPATSRWVLNRGNRSPLRISPRFSTRSFAYLTYLETSRLNQRISPLVVNSCVMLKDINVPLNSKNESVYIIASLMMTDSGSFATLNRK